MKNLKIIFFAAINFLFLPELISQTINKELVKDMKFRHVGPIGNRLTTVAGVPNNPLVYYVGAASGGVWKTNDSN